MLTYGEGNSWNDLYDSYNFLMNLKLCQKYEEKK